MTGPEPVQASLLQSLLGVPVAPHSSGGESRTFRVGETRRLVTVDATWPEVRLPAHELLRRVALQSRIAARVSAPVPHVVEVLPRHGLVIVDELGGVPLIQVSPQRRASLSHDVAVTVGRLLGELHTWEPAAYRDLATTDPGTPQEWLEECAELVVEIGGELTVGQRRDVERFLAEPPPGPTNDLTLTHHDLGIEHVLVSDGQVSGIIDWADAAVGDPAHDFGLLLRDLGRPALAAALAAYEAAGAAPDGIAPRAGFYARCKLIEDLAFGLAHHRPAYVEKSHAAWRQVFPEASRQRVAR